MAATASKELEVKVIQENLCTLCGACTGLCPYLVAYRGRVVLRDECTLTRGRCYSFCPRISVNLNDIHKACFSEPYQWNALGKVKGTYIARATDASVRAKAQYGGVVTALMSFALKEGLVDAAALTASGSHDSPGGILATTKGEVRSCSGSTYSAAPTAGFFNAAATAGDRQKIGMVGTPCQVMALSKMRVAGQDARSHAEKAGLAIGLFCTWALSSEEFARFLESRVPLKEIRKVDIPPPPANVFVVYTGSRKISIPLDAVRPFVRPACKYCLDMTAEFADISVGAVEGMDGWNTVIARSKRGAELLKKARSAKVLEVGALPEQNLKHLKEASLLKKKRGLKNIIEKTGSIDDLLYLDTDAKAVKEFLNE